MLNVILNGANGRMGRVLNRLIAEKEDINEEYVFDLLDKWASKRKIKTKK